ncbi:hypothetical protein ABKA04_008770 [Annulohypoxylon sp. FPYF3050]
MMGDSAGVVCDHCDGYEQFSGTLGVLFQVDGVGYWIVNSHILPNTIDDPSSHELKLYQPSIPDYVEIYGSNPEPGFHNLGTFAAWSGKACMTTRRSLHTFNDERGHSVVTDWAAFRAPEIHNNQLRITDMEDANDNYVCSGSHVVPGRRVRVSGRTSGLTEAFISLVPSIVLPLKEYRLKVDQGRSYIRHGNGTGVMTREWAIRHDTEENYEQQAYDDFVKGGAGLPGDSGAPIIDTDNQKYYGLLWGRNEYSDSDIIDDADRVQGTAHIPRISYFTTYHDLRDDIKEKMGSQQHPKLPNITEHRNDLPRRSGAATRSKPKRSIQESVRKMLAVAATPANRVLHVPTSLHVRTV